MCRAGEVPLWLCTHAAISPSESWATINARSVWRRCAKLLRMIRRSTPCRYVTWMSPAVAKSATKSSRKCWKRSSTVASDALLQRPSSTVRYTASRPVSILSCSRMRWLARLLTSAPPATLGCRNVSVPCTTVMQRCRNTTMLPSSLCWRASSLPRWRSIAWSSASIASSTRDAVMRWLCCTRSIAWSSELVLYALTSGSMSWICRTARWYRDALSALLCCSVRSRFTHHAAPAKLLWTKLSRKKCWMKCRTRALRWTCVCCVGMVRHLTWYLHELSRDNLLVCAQ